MNVQFRIFDEEQSEASVDLEEKKTYRVGNSMQFDIFLSSVQDGDAEGSNYFDFSVHGKVISFFQQSGKVTYIDFINHTNNLVDSSYTYEIPCLFEFMGVKFALCDARDSWEKWLTIINTKPERIEQPLNENPEMSASEVAQLNAIAPQSKAKNEKKLFPFDLKNFGIKFSPKGKKFLTIIGGAVFVVILLLIIFSSVQKYSMQHFAKNQQANISDIQSIKQIEVNLPTRFNNLKYMSNQTDMVVVIGVVKDQEDVNYIHKQFEKYKKIVTFKLITANEAIHKLNIILKSRNIPLLTPAFNSTTYRIYLTGLLQSMDAVNDIELDVSNQIPEISDLDMSQVFSVKDVDKDVDDLISKNNLANRLTIKKNIAARTVYIGGYLSQSEISDLKADVSTLVTKYQNLITIKLDLKDAAASLPFRIVSVNTGGFPSFMTDSGQKVFEGGEIEGMKVDKITSSEIDFSGKFPLVYKLDGGSGGQ